MLLEFKARRVRAFADDLSATFDTAAQALDAALEIHRRIAVFNDSGLAGGLQVGTCIGLGYGEVFAIGPDRAMGDEMNRTSKLGEDTAVGGETLVTDGFYAEVSNRTDCRFESGTDEDIKFPFYRVLPPG